MKTGQRIIKNFLSLSIAEIISRLSGMALVIYIARVLGASVFGQLSFAIAFTSYFTLFSDFGLTTLGIREVAKDKSKTSSYGTNILFLQTGIALFLIFILSTILIFVPLDNRLKLITFLFGLGIIPGALNLSYIFYAYEKMEYIAITRIIAQVSYVIVGFGFVYVLKDILVLPVVSLISAFLGSGMVFYLLKKKIRFVWGKINWTRVKNLGRRALPFLVSALAIQFYYNIDSIMLQFMKGSEAVGYYNAAYKVVLLLITFGGLFHISIYPTLANFLKHNFKKAIDLVGRASKLSILISIPLVVGGVILAPKIIQLLFGSEYFPSVLSFQILIWSVFTVYTNVAFAATLLASNHEKDYTKSVVMGAVLNLIFNLLLIPKFGLAGAASATTITELYVLLMLYYYAHKIIGVGILKNLIQGFFAAIIMGAVLFFLKLNVIFLILLGGGLYVTLLILFRFIDKDDISFICSLLKREP